MKKLRQNGRGQKLRIKNLECRIMANIDLKDRTKNFSLRIIRLVNALPKDVVGRAIANQLIRSGMSVGANFRAACRGRSKAEFSAKLGIALEEIDECGYWLEIIIDLGIIPKKKVTDLASEAEELTAIFCTSIKTSKKSISSKS
jgi:four helix bundle protein